MGRSRSRSQWCGQGPQGAWRGVRKPFQTLTLESTMGFEFAPGKTRIGWVGTGVMGTSMCGHLIAAGYQATIYNRSV
ncbi:MAG: NAD(P)-binding domain-containing protein, partial [Isosphaeraceae bacterium]